MEVEKDAITTADAKSSSVVQQEKSHRDFNQGPHDAIQIDAVKPAAPAKHSFPWRGGACDKFRKWLLSEEFQGAVQLAVGTFVVALFVFVERLRFERACLSTILFVAAMLLVAKDSHVGSRLAGAALLLGAFWFGALIAACVISLGRAPHVAYTTFLILFTAVGLMVTTTLRVKANLGVGILSNLGFGIMLTGGQFIWPAQPLWQYEYTRLLRIALVASLGVLVSGLFFLPSLAGDDMRMKLADILKDLGHIVSEAAGHLLLRRRDEQQALKGESREGREEKSRSARELNLRTLEERQDEEQMERFSQPGADLRPQWTKQKGVIKIADVRARLARCREVFAMSALEPPFLRWGTVPYNTFRWPAVMNALDTLVMRVAALESIIEGEDPMMLDGELKQQLGLSLLPAFRLLFAQIAASCASAAQAILADVINKRGEHKLLFEPSWAVIEYELAGALYTGLKSFWATLKAKPRDFIDPSPEVRALLYMGTIGNALMETMAAFEASLRAALHTEDVGDSSQVARPVLDAIQILREAVLSPEAVNVMRNPAPWGAPGRDPTPVSVMCHSEMEREKTASQEQIEDKDTQRPKMREGFVSFRRSMTMRPMQKNLEAGGAEPVAAEKDSSAHSKGSVGHAVRRKHGVAAVGPAAKDRVMRNFAWTIPLLKAIFAWDVVDVFRDLATKDIPGAFGGSLYGVFETFWRDRWFQFAAKYYSASMIVLGILLALQANYEEVRNWNGLYVNITVVVVLSEKVDTTFQKGVLRILTTVIGGVLGFLVMLDADVATNPYGLMAINVAFAFVCGLMSLGTLKYAIFLTLITFDGISLCQYTGRTPGSAKNFYTRLVVTVWGVMLCLAFDLLFPWYAASSAMQDLGRSFEAAGEIMQHFLSVMSEELEMGRPHGESEDAAEARKQGILRMEQGILQKRVAAPLGGVQVSLAKEGVLWRRGVLAMPLIVRQALDILQALLDRLAAVELMLLQKPIVSGRYSGAPWHYLHRPVTPEREELKDSILALCLATGRVMGEFPTEKDLEGLERAIHDLHQCRLKWRAAYRAQLQVYLAKIYAETVEPLIAERSIDDGIRYQSATFALSKATDKIMLLARTVAADPWIQLRARHRHKWRTWRSWLGKYGYD